VEFGCQVLHLVVYELQFRENHFVMRGLHRKCTYAMIVRELEMKRELIE